MTDRRAVAGSLVRDHRGRRGRVASVAADSVTLAWPSPPSLLSRLEELPRTDARMRALEALTASGWVRLSEADFSPFQHKRVLGPGPKNVKRKKTGDFVCRSTGRYKQSCIDRSKPGVRRKVVSVSPKAKRAKAKYRDEYRKWLKKKKETEGGNDATAPDKREE